MSNNSEIALGAADYALQITKGTAKLLALEGDKITASYVLADTFSAKVLKAAAMKVDTLNVANYTIAKSGDALIIGDNSGNGLAISGQIASYTTAPIFAADAQNAIINKEYVDTTIQLLQADIAGIGATLNDSLKPIASRIDTAFSRLAGLTGGLTDGRLAK